MTRILNLATTQNGPRYTEYTKLTLSDREHTSNGEMEHVTFIMEDKETICKEQQSKWTKCSEDTKKQILNKVHNLSQRKIAAGIAAVTVSAILLFVMYQYIPCQVISLKCIL